LGTVQTAPFGTQVAVLTGMAILMTVGVYGFVAGIVKLDDLGLWLTRQASGLAQSAGRGILAFAPWLMKALSVAGTVAMFLVGGGIVVHGLPWLHHAIEGVAKSLGGVLPVVVPMLADAAVGLSLGAVLVAVVMGVKKLRG
jgi:uncharacterized protein